MDPIDELFSSLGDGPTCEWCGIFASVTVLYLWPTCRSCVGSRAERVRAYCARLARAGRA